MAFDTLTMNKDVLYLFYFLWKQSPRHAPHETGAWLDRELSAAASLKPQPQVCTDSNFNAEPCVSCWKIRFWKGSGNVSGKHKSSRTVGAATTSPDPTDGDEFIPAITVAQVHTHPDLDFGEHKAADPKPSGPEGSTDEIKQKLEQDSMKTYSDVRTAATRLIPIYVVSAKALWKVDHDTLQKVQLAGADWYHSVHLAVNSVSPAKASLLMGALEFGSRKGLSRRAIETQDFRPLV